MWEHSVKKFEVGVGTMDTVCDPGQGIKSGTVGVKEIWNSGSGGAGRV